MQFAVIISSNHACDLKISNVLSLEKMETKITNNFSQVYLKLTQVEVILSEASGALVFLLV